MFFTSCEHFSFWDEGNEVTRKVTLDNFETIDFKSIFDVVLVADSINYIIVKCGENNFKDINIEVINNVLSISQIAKTNWTRTYKHTQIEIHYKLLSNIQIKECILLNSRNPIKNTSICIEDYGELSELNIDIDCVNFKMSINNDNCGKYKVKGKALNSSLKLNGSSHFFTELLEVDSLNVIHNGIGNCIVNAKRVIYCDLLINGTLKYKTHKDLKIHINTRKGRVIGF